MKYLVYSAAAIGFCCSATLAQDANVETNQAEVVDQTKPTEKQRPATFSGSWTTAYGVLTLKQDGDKVTGAYDLGTVEGRVADRVLKFRYREKNAAGEGQFTLAEDGNSFRGTWRVADGQKWYSWSGKRREPTLKFAGLWKTTFGPMRLAQDGNDIRGTYAYGGGESTISGQLKGNRFVFRYREPEVQGAGWFELSANGMEMTGKWRRDGQKLWKSWNGSRKLARPGRTWLVILEANWERSIEEQQYAFADMLEQYFTMATARHIDVRKRAFHDERDLRRFCREIKFLAEPVVLLISTHGTPKGITVSGETITAEVLAQSLAGSDNLKLLHLSGCSMMSGDFPSQIHSNLRDDSAFPISGYKTSVAWDASALGDFTFLSMLLIRRLEPAAAVKQSILVSPYLGDKRVPGAAFQPLGLSVLPPPEQKNELADEDNTGSPHDEKPEDGDNAPSSAVGNFIGRLIDKLENQ